MTQTKTCILEVRRPRLSQGQKKTGVPFPLAHLHVAESIGKGRSDLIQIKGNVMEEKHLERKRTVFPASNQKKGRSLYCFS